MEPFRGGWALDYTEGPQGALGLEYEIEDRVEIGSIGGTGRMKGH